MKDQVKRAKSSNKAPAMQEAFVSVDKWLEHMEEVIEPSCLTPEHDDLNLVLKNSPEDLETLETLKRVRAAVKASDDVVLPESGHYYDALHEKIMASIDNEITMSGKTAHTVPKARVGRFSFFGFAKVPQGVFGAIGMTMMVAIISFVGLRHQTSQKTATQSEQAMADAGREASIEENFERKIAMVDSHSGATFARDMGAFESEEDFLTESAVSRLKQVSVQQAEAMFRSLRR